MDAVERAIRHSRDPRQGVDAQRRVDVLRPLAASQLVAHHLADAQVLDLVAHVDAEPVERQVEPACRRPHDAGRPRFAGFRIQVLVALATADDAFAAVVAVIERQVTLFFRATPVIGRGGFVIAGPGEHVVQVRRAECRAVGATYQQAVEGTPFKAGAPRELGRFTAREVVAVVAARHADVEGRQHRHAQFAGHGPAAAAALARGVLPAVVVVLGGQRVGLDVVTLVADFGGRGEADRAARHVEQVGLGQRQRKCLRRRLRMVGGVGEDAVEFLRRQRRP